MIKAKLGLGTAGIQLDIHKPKPVHSWRELASEIGVVVIGIAIALSGEQALEALHWAERVKGAEADMRNELTTDDGPQAYMRMAQSPCISAQLDDMKKAILDERDQHVPLQLKAPTVPTFWTWDRNAYDQAMESSTMVHMPVERAYAWSAPYSLEAALNAASVKEASDYAELDDVTSAPLHPSAALSERLLAAISRARADNVLITTVSARFIELAKQPHVSLADDQKRLDLDADHGKFAACRTIPKL